MEVKKVARGYFGLLVHTNKIEWNINLNFDITPLPCKKTLLSTPLKIKTTLMTEQETQFRSNSFYFGIFF